MPAWVVNPDGLRATSSRAASCRAVSWTLKEQVTFDEHGISASVDWGALPDPEVQRAAGDRGRAGRARRQSLASASAECTVGPTAAAIGNAVAHAARRVRINDMPLTRERIMSALLK